MFKKIALAALLIIAALLLFATTRPDTLRVERTTRIDASPDTIFPLIDDFHRWASWSPYEKLDPAMEKNYSGADNGKGAVYAWEGNSQVGAGRMEIVDVSTPSKVTIKLDFLRPFETHNTAEFRLEPSGDATNVTWAMYGPNLYIGKVMSVFFNMDKLIGADFETGLANLKALAEKK